LPFSVDPRTPFSHAQAAAAQSLSSVSRCELAVFGLTAALFVAMFFTLFVVLSPANARAVLGDRAHDWLHATRFIAGVKRELLHNAAEAARRQHVEM
jgi:hypothetical protein